MVKDDKAPCAEKGQFYLVTNMECSTYAWWERRGRSFLGEEAALVSKHGHVMVQDTGQPSVRPQVLGRAWIEQQEMVLLGQDPSRNGDSKSLSLAGIGPSSTPPSRGWGGG